MRVDDRPRHREESRSTTLARELRLAAHREERPISSHQVVCDAGRLIENVDLSVEDVLGLLVCVGGNVAGWARLDAVEAGCEVGRANAFLSLSLDRVEVCDDGGFAFGDRDVLLAGAFDDCERDGSHYDRLLARKTVKSVRCEALHSLLMVFSVVCIWW